MSVYPFADHNAPNFHLIEEFCKDAVDYLGRDEQNVIVVHCKAGKGRTGTMISSLLLYLSRENIQGRSAPSMPPSPLDRAKAEDMDPRDITSAEQALRFFAVQRTSDGNGVTIPSQQRSVRYFEKYLRIPDALDFKKELFLKCVRINTVPHFDSDKGSDPYFVLYKKISAHDGEILDQVFNYKLVKGTKHFAREPFVLLPNLNVRMGGDYLFEFYDYDRMSKDEKMFHFYINTAFVEKDNKIRLARKEIDRACKRKYSRNFDDDFSVELSFSDSALMTFSEASDLLMLNGDG